MRLVTCIAREIVAQYNFTTICKLDDQI